MRTIRMFLSLGICIAVCGPTESIKEIATPKEYDEAVLQRQFVEFVESLDILKISKDYPGAIRKLFSGDPEKQIKAVRTLAETGEVEVIPWLLPFLDADHDCLRISTGSSLAKLVSSYVLRRRDLTAPEAIVIKPLRPEDKDLRPLAWIVLKMLRKPDDGNTHAYAVSMARYLELYEFERELRQCLKSKHPAVAQAAKRALRSLGQEKQYQNATSNRDVDPEKK